MTTPAARKRRLLSLVGIAVLLLAALGVQQVRQRLREAHGHTVDGLVERMAEGGEGAAQARDELVARQGAHNVAYWAGLMASSPSPHVRFAATDVLAEDHGQEAAKALSGALADYYSLVRVTAVDGLGRCQRPETLRTLLAASQDDDTDVRHSALLQLARCGDRRAVPVLVKTLGHPDPMTVAAAAYALRKLTDKPFRVLRHDTPEGFQRGVRQWETWWAAAKGSWPVDPALADVPATHPTRTKQAPETSVRDVSGTHIRSQELRGRVVVVSFWATWCPECHEQMSRLDALARQYGPRGLSVVGLAMAEDGPEPVRAFAARTGLTYPVALASPGVCAAWDHVTEVPVTFMLDRQGRIRYQWDGPRDRETFAAAAERLLADR